MSHDNDRDSRVAERAYRKWEEEGRPAGRHDAHWHDAAQEIDADPIAGADPEAVPAAERGAAPEPAKPKAKRAPKAAPIAGATPAKPRKPRG